MAGILKTAESSASNIQNFINLIENEDLRQIFKEHWQNIIAVGKLEANSEKSQQLRLAFFDAIKKVIDDKMGEQQ
jgi:hypothetical protein